MSSRSTWQSAWFSSVLHDFSYAGCHHGGADLPWNAGATIFEMVADTTGRTDSTAAIQAAIDRAEESGGAEYLPTQNGETRGIEVVLKNCAGLAVGDEISLGWVVTPEDFVEGAGSAADLETPSLYLSQIARRLGQPAKQHAHPAP